MVVVLGLVWVGCFGGGFCVVVCAWMCYWCPVEVWGVVFVRVLFCYLGVFWWLGVSWVCV